MAKFKRICGVIIIMGLVLSSSVLFVPQLATADDAGRGPQDCISCKACGMETRAEPIEEAEPEDDASNAGLTCRISNGQTTAGGNQDDKAEMFVRLVSKLLKTPSESNLPGSNNAVWPRATWQNIMTEDFEGVFPGDWTVWATAGSTDAYWGKDGYNAHTGLYSAFCAKSGTAGVNPPADYHNNMEAYMMYGPFSLTDAVDAEVSFHWWYQTEISFDRAWCMALVDEDNYVYTWTSGTSEGWESESVSLGTLCGQPEVWLAFIFTSNVSITYQGAFVDDVVLQKYVPSTQFDLEALEVYLSTIPGDTAKEHVASEPTVGQDVYFHFKWNCIGSGTTPSFRDELKLDGATFCYGEGTADGGYSYTEWCTSPWTATAGAHTLTGVLDVYDDIMESNETNNEASRSWGGASEATWTFMVYSDGDNNLEPSEIVTFNLMEYAANNTNVNVIVQLDRIPGYDTSNGDWTTTRRYKVKHDTDLVSFASYTAGVDYWDLGELSMADPNTLIDFASWAMTTYPADHYCLVVSNHGGGWQPKGSGQPVPKGIVWDDTSGDYMTTAEMGSALNSITSGGTEKLDVLFLDACLMQMIEVGYEVKDYSQHLVTTEYIGYGPGPYHDYVSYFTPTTTAQELAIAVVNYYGAWWTPEDLAYTMSAVDLSQYGLASVVSDFAQALTAGVSTYHAEIESARDACQKFELDSYIDLYHFAYLIDQNIADATIQTAAQAVMAAVNNAVIAEAHESGGGIGLDDAHGISIYFPASEGDSGYSNYNSSNLQFVADKGWDEFLAAFFNPVTGEVNINMQPATRDVAVGEVFDITIQAEAGDQPVSGIDAFVDFDPAYLEVQSVTPGASLPTVLENTYDNTAGTIDYSAGKLGAPFPTGTFTVATIQFKALDQTSPSTSITFSTDPPRKTRADYAGGDVTGTLTGAIVAITLDAPIFLDPASSENICIGQTFTLDIKTNVDGEQPVSGVQAFVDFDPTYLEVLSVTPGASLPTVLQNTYDNTAGTIDYSAGKLGAPFPTGEFTVATIEFEALAETSGTAVTFSFTGPRTTAVDLGGSPIPGIHGDATVEIVPGALVDISVVLQGGSRPPEGWEVPITIRFFSPGADVMTDTPIYEFNLTTTKVDSTATCQCAGVMPGTYDITVKASNCPECEEGNCTLTNVKRSVVISTPSTSLDMGTLLAGDANCSGIINISDFGILAVSYMCTVGAPCYDCRADFDCNGIINISDFGLLAVNYMKMSPIDVS
jgi:hypothetical protein